MNLTVNNNQNTNQFKVVNGQPFVSSLYVAEVTGKRHDHVIRDIRVILEQCDEEFGKPNFGECSYQSPSDHIGGRKYTMYWLSEDGSSVLLGGYSIAHRVKIQKELRSFKDNLLKTPKEIEDFLTSPDTILKLAQNWKDEQSKRLLAEAQIEKDKPKVIFADAVAVSNSTILVGELAKLIKQNGVDIGQNRLYDYLRNAGYLVSRKGTDYNMPTQKSMELKLFNIKETAITHSDGHVSVSKTVKVTGKGSQYFINKFLKGKELSTN